MKELALALIRGMDDPGLAVNRLREYLQCLVLRSLHDCEAFRSMAFVGGTALRFLHGLPRFSEDLEFSLISPESYTGRDWMTSIKRDLSLAGFDLDVTWNEQNVVQVGWVRVAGLLREAGYSSMATEKLSIKIEIDTRPPAGARSEKRLVTRHVTFLLQYYDLPSLMAGKLHAVLTRKHTKGRDWYDLAWYLSHRQPVARTWCCWATRSARRRTPGVTLRRAGQHWSGIGSPCSMWTLSRGMSVPSWNGRRTRHC